jgi:hypothetical protein
MLDSIKVIKRRIPINGHVSLAIRVLTNEIFFNDFTIETAPQRFFEGKCKMKFVRRLSFKNPMTIRTFESKFGCSHNTSLSKYYVDSRLKTDQINLNLIKFLVLKL